MGRFLLPRRDLGLDSVEERRMGLVLVPVSGEVGSVLMEFRFAAECLLGFVLVLGMGAMAMLEVGLYLLTTGVGSGFAARVCSARGNGYAVISRAGVGGGGGGGGGSSSSSGGGDVRKAGNGESEEQVRFWRRRKAARQDLYDRAPSSLYCVLCIIAEQGSELTAHTMRFILCTQVNNGRSPHNGLTAVGFSKRQPTYTCRTIPTPSIG